MAGFEIFKSFVARNKNHALHRLQTLEVLFAPAYFVFGSVNFKINADVNFRLQTGHNLRSNEIQGHQSGKKKKNEDHHAGCAETQKAVSFEISPPCHINPFQSF